MEVLFRERKGGPKSSAGLNTIAHFGHKIGKRSQRPVLELYPRPRQSAKNCTRTVPAVSRLRLSAKHNPRRRATSIESQLRRRIFAWSGLQEESVETTKILLETKLPAGSVAGIICLSVIEHGVDIPRRAGNDTPGSIQEVARLLRPNGRLYLSTDYWDPQLDTGGRKMYGLPWKVLSGKELGTIMQTAEGAGLKAYPRDPSDLRCDVPVVHDGPHAYTFAAMQFYKKAA